MAHSGGGGSHSGGSHGGGGSHSSHGGSGSSGSSGKTSSTYFSGARTFYVYNKKTHSGQLKYANYNYKTGGIIECFIPLLVGVIEYVIMLGILVSSLSGVVKYKTNTPNEANPCIVDSVNMLTTYETEDLTNSMRNFQKSTGITPIVVLNKCSNCDWFYSEFADYAIEEYYARVTDETYMLVLYISDDTATQGDFNEYYYETVWGDDTVHTFGSYGEDQFLNILQGQLHLSNDKEVASALCNTFDKTGAEWRSYKNIDFGFVPVVGFFILHGGVFLWTGLKGIIDVYKKKNLYEIKELRGPTELMHCAYCGVGYPEGIYGTCPHCGAPL